MASGAQDAFSSAMVRKVSITSADRCVSGGGNRRSARRVALPGRGFFERRGMQPGMLADVECLQMQAVGADLEDQRIDQGIARAGGRGSRPGWRAGSRGPRATPGPTCKQVDQQRCIQSRRRASGDRDVASAGEAHPDAAQEAPVRFILVALAEGLIAGGVERVEITRSRCSSASLTGTCCAELVSRSMTNCSRCW